MTKSLIRSNVEIFFFIGMSTFENFFRCVVLHVINLGRLKAVLCQFFWATLIFNCTFCVVVYNVIYSRTFLCGNRKNLNHNNFILTFFSVHFVRCARRVERSGANFHISKYYTKTFIFEDNELKEIGRSWIYIFKMNRKLSPLEWFTNSICFSPKIFTYAKWRKIFYLYAHVTFAKTTHHIGLLCVNTNIYIIWP